MSFFTWWNHATIGTRWHVFRRARKIGTDNEGNVYFEERSPSIDNRKRRYVIYNGIADPSRISADWHGWMHHAFTQPPLNSSMPRRHYEQDHQHNLTGTKKAWHPKGSLAAKGQRNKSQADYQPWCPDD